MNTQRILPPVAVSLGTIEQNSLQEILTFIACHLLSQGEKAVTEHTACRYRLEKPKGILSCAIGCIIPDSMYRSDMEGKTFTSLINSLGIIVGAENNDRYMLLNDLQKVHDNKVIEDWERSLKELAKGYKLQVEWDSQGNYISTGL